MIILKFILISAAIYLTLALGLVLSQWQRTFSDENLKFYAIPKQTILAPVEVLEFQTRYGMPLKYRDFPTKGADGGPLVVMLHGSGAHGGLYESFAADLADRGAAQVVVPDLRGHGANTGPKGDVTYIGQMEDDITDLINHIGVDDRKLVLMGHSSGGGLAVRYAGGDQNLTLDGAVLIAPFLKYDAPTMRPNSGGWAAILVRRIIGLNMLNTVGIKVLNFLPIIDFNLPENGAELGMVPSYSYRLNQSYAPRSDYLADVAKLPNFAVIAGENDEAFKAQMYEPTLSPVNGNGSYHIIKGAGHLDVIFNTEALKTITMYLGDFK